MVVHFAQGKKDRDRYYIWTARPAARDTASVQRAPTNCASGITHVYSNSTKKEDRAALESHTQKMVNINDTAQQNCIMTNVMHKFLIYSSIYFCHVLGFLLVHFQRQVYKFGSGCSLLGMVSVPGC
jgi:hypothetical protein